MKRSFADKGDTYFAVEIVAVETQENLMMHNIGIEAGQI